jgi:muramidase (phage lysozyme)
MTAKLNRDIYDVMWAIKMIESHGNYKAKSKWSSASGAYQFIDSTWDNYEGYARAVHAPAKIQDKKMYYTLRWRFWIMGGDWEKVIAGHFYPAWAKDKSKWNRSPGCGNPTIREYVDKVMEKAKL